MMMIYYIKVWYWSVPNMNNGTGTNGPCSETGGARLTIYHLCTYMRRVRSQSFRTSTYMSNILHGGGYSFGISKSIVAMIYVPK